MGLGKAQKQRRNIDAKIAKREAEEKARREHIESLDNDRVYLIDPGDGRNDRLRLPGRVIKEMNNIKVVEKSKPKKVIKLSLIQKIRLKLQITWMSIKYAYEQCKGTYRLKRKLQSGEIIGDVVQKPKQK